VTISSKKKNNDISLIFRNEYYLLIITILIRAEDRPTAI